MMRLLETRGGDIPQERMMKEANGTALKLKLLETEEVT